MIKGIFFDASGVVYKHEVPMLQYARRLFKDQGYAADLSAEDEARLGNMKDLAHDGIITVHAYWDGFLKMCGVEDPAKRAGLMDRILEQANKVYGLPGAHETMRTLKKRGFILGIVSGSIYPAEWKKAWLEVAGVAEFIDVLVYSTELGSRKPHPSIYWTALNKARLTPRQTAYVGNGGEKLAGARRVGMVTVAVLYDPDAEADYYAKTLPELLNLPIFQQ
jgi:HAD superfamily hydrolase (TIGR01509 family)